MYQIEAKYFDGQSSVPHQIALLTSERFDELRLQYADGSSSDWSVHDLSFEQYGDCLEVRNRQFSGALLQIKDKDFSKKFLEAMKWKNKVDVHQRILSIGFPRIVGIAVVMLVLIVVAYFYLLPPIAEKSAALLPESFDTYLGNVFMGTFLDENKIDSTKTTGLENFAAQINFENTKPLSFAVVKSDEINAFALPNGQIVVYSGILDKMQNPSELAALLAHEAAHVNHRHSTKMLCRNLAGYMLVSLIFSDVNGIMAVLADNAHQLHSLSYSRKFENESDEQGLKILMDNHIDPNGMVQLFELIEKEEKIAIPKIISTHPITKERKENMQQTIEKSEYSLVPNNNLDSIFVEMQQ
jgi:Zn-dependent protease with chaperone function